MLYGNNGILPWKDKKTHLYFYYLRNRNAFQASFELLLISILCPIGKFLHEHCQDFQFVAWRRVFVDKGCYLHQNLKMPSSFQCYFHWGLLVAIISPSWVSPEEKGKEGNFTNLLITQNPWGFGQSLLDPPSQRFATGSLVPCIPSQPRSHNSPAYAWPSYQLQELQ